MNGPHAMPTVDTPARNAQLPVLTHVRLTVTKWNGDPPKPGETKEPAEVIVIDEDLTK